MLNTSTLVIDKILKASSLHLKQVGQSKLSQYGISVNVEVNNINLNTYVKNCITEVSYVIVFKMVTEKWLSFVERESKEFILSMINQANVKSFEYNREETGEENFKNIYWDLTINI